MKNIKKLIIVFSIIIIVIITFGAKYITLIKKFEGEVQSKVILLDRYSELCNTFISMMMIYGNDFFLQDTSEDSEFYNFLEYNKSQDAFHLDAVFGTEHQKKMGNITGIGSIPKSGTKRDEINLAFQYNQFFNSLYERIPDVTWLYYTSKSDFINIYPWIASDTFTYTKDLKTAEFYTYVIPQNNPQRNYRWTPVYKDYAGKGLMISLSGPIYNKDTFMGVISLDLSNKQLSAIMSSNYEGYVIDNTDSVIASNSELNFNEDLIKIDTLVKNFTHDKLEILDVKYNSVHKVGLHYIYAIESEHAPWKMIFRLSIASILLQSVVETLPIFIIGVLFLLALSEVEKRKNTVLLLNNSFNELKSYQEILENSAKYDFLTSTFNRRGFKERFNEYMDKGKTTQIPIAFILGDIDYFKKLNDTYGHNAGDQVLIEISNLMKNSITDADVICRWGGEEFLIMLFEKTYEEALVIADNIRTTIEAMMINWEGSQIITTTMTLGVTEYDYEKTLEINVSNADNALYLGKENGRNRVVGYHELALQVGS